MQERMASLQATINKLAKGLIVVESRQTRQDQGNAANKNERQIQAMHPRKSRKY